MFKQMLSGFIAGAVFTGGILLVGTINSPVTVPLIGLGAFIFLLIEEMQRKQ